MGVLDPRLKHNLQASDASFTAKRQNELNNALEAYKSAHGGQAAPLAQPNDATVSQHVEPSFLQNAAFSGKSFITGAMQPLSEIGDATKHFGRDIEKGLNYLGEKARGASPAEHAQDIAAIEGPDAWGNEPLNPDIAKHFPNGLTNPFNLNKEYIERGDEGHPFATMAKDFGNLTGTIVASGASGGSTFVLQGIGSGANEVDKMKANGVKFENGTDEMYIYGKGLINLMLHKSIAGTVLEGKPELTNDVVSSLSADATKELAEKGAAATTQDIVNTFSTKATNFTQGLQQWGLGVIKKYPIVGAEMAAANVANVGLKASVNALNDKKVFEQGGNLSDVPGAIGSAFYGGDPHDTRGDIGKAALGLLNSPAAGFSLLHGISTAGALLPGSRFKNVVVESLQHDSSPGNIEKIKSQLADIGAQKGWSEDEIHNTQQTVDALADVASKIPKDMEPAKFGKAVDIIAKRRTLEAILKTTDAKATSLDPAFTDKVEPFKELLNARIEKENDNLTELIKDKKFTYSFQEGKYYKTMSGGEPEEITKDRYDLEKLKTEQPDASAPVEGDSAEAKQPEPSPATEVPVDKTPKPAPPAAGLDELDNELDNLKQPEEKAATVEEKPVVAEKTTTEPVDDYETSVVKKSYFKNVALRAKPDLNIDDVRKESIAVAKANGNDKVSFGDFEKATHNLINKEEPNDAISKRSSKTPNVGETSGNSPKMGGRVPEPEKPANARTSEEVQSNGEEAPSAIGRQSAGEHGVSEEEIKAANEAHANQVDEKIRPIADQMVKIENQFNNEGYDLSDDYDDEVQVTNKKTGEQLGPEDLPEHLQELAAQYETVLSKLAEHTHEMGKHLHEARQRFKGEDITHEDVTNQRLPEANKPYFIAKGSPEAPEHEETNGKPVLAETGLDLFVHERPGDTVDYSVSEGSTGLSIAQGDTEQEAIDNAKDFIDKHTPEGTKKIIDQKYEQGIKSPRGRVAVSEPGRTEAVIAKGTATLRKAEAVTGSVPTGDTEKAEKAIRSIDAAIGEIDKHLDEMGFEPETGEPKEPEAEPEPIERDQRKAERDAKKAKVKEKLDAAKKAFLDSLNKATSGIDPESLAKGLKMMAVYAEAGILKFRDIAEDLADELGEGLRDIFDALKTSYLAYAAHATEDEVDQMDNTRDVRKIKIDDILTPQENGTGSESTALDDNTLELAQGVQPRAAAGAGEGEQAQKLPSPENGGGGENGNEPQGAKPAIARPDTGRGSANGTGTGERGAGVEPANRDTGRQVRPDTEKRVVKPEDQNHVIKPSDTIVPPGKVGKFNANMDALLLLKRLEGEDRNPTPAEKQKLAQFVGWGGLADYLKTDNYSANEAVTAYLQGKRTAVFNRETYRHMPVDFTVAGPVDLSKFDNINDAVDSIVKGIRNAGVSISPDDVRAPLVKNMLSATEYQDALNSTINAHYTDRAVINHMWDIVKKLGFSGGKVLEPSAGIGHFFGLMPKELVGKTSLTGYELDSITGRLLKKLYPQANITVGGFEHSRVPVNSVDLAISNVPFAASAPYDKNFPELSKFSMHNYFIAKNLKLLKPGGIAMMITSSSTMDAPISGKFREWVTAPDGGNSYLVGAIRLPNNAFDSNAGTQVTTDMLVFQKKGQVVDSTLEQPFRFTKLLKTATGKEGGEVPIHVNEYYIDHPEQMLGDMMLAHEAGSGGLYGPDNATLKAPDNINIEKELKKASGAFPENIVGNKTVAEKEPEQAITATDKKEGSLFVKDKKVYRVQDGEGSPVDLTPKQVAMTTDYMDLKNGLLNLISLEQQENNPEANIDAQRKELNKDYDKFVKKHGNVNSRSTGFLNDIDIDFPLVSSLENVDRKLVVTGGKDRFIDVISKGDILTKRINFPRVEPTVAADIKDAMNISLNFRSGIDIGYMARMLDKDEDTVREDILNNELGYENPDTGIIETPEEYLSGFVRDKLRKAEAAAANDKIYTKNVTQLKKIIPEDIPSSLISYSLGSSWIPEHVYEEFAKQIFQGAVKIKYLPTAGKYIVNPYGAKYSAAVQNTYAAGGVDGIKILDATLNNKQMVVSDTVEGMDGVKRQVKNIQKTAAAQAMQAQIQGEFQEWVNGNEPVQKETERIYNDVFNGQVNRTFRIPDFKHYPGASTTIDLREHQKRAVSRGLSESTLFAHEVGSGKTFTIITTAMEMRRLGTARKPVIVVQNSTLGQFVASFKKLYPGAKILAPSKKEMQADGRKKLFAKIATGDWDAIILPHSQITMIPDDPERQKAYIMEQIEEMKATLATIDDKREQNKLKTQIEAMQKEMDGIGQDSFDDEGNIILKKGAGKSQAKKIGEKSLKITAGMEKVLDRKVDNLLNFEQMGIDALLVDEAHAYKKLGFQTSMNNIKGIDTGKSQRSQSILLKSRWIHEKTGGKNVNFYTGTPISNTMAEAWTMMRYMRPDILEHLGIQYFDQFAKTFGQVVPSLEQTAGGTFKIQNRFAKFQNLPEFINAFKTATDVVLTDDVKEFQNSALIPKMAGGKPTLVVIEQSPELKKQIKQFRETLEWFDKLSGKEKREFSYIPLVTYTQAKKASIDLRLLDPSNVDSPQSKANQAVKRVFQIWKDTREAKSTQMIFSDLYQSPEPKDVYLDEDGLIKNPAYGKDRFNLFNDIKKKLVALGVPEHEIAIITEPKYDKVERKELLFEDFNEGKVRIALGTTEKMGVGVNAQRKMIAMHNLDAPARPMDMIQRVGRIIRQGNEHREVQVNNYGVEKTLDASAYQTLATKEGFIKQMMKGENIDRVTEDAADESSMGFEEMMAHLSDSPFAMQKLMVDNKLNTEKMKQQNFNNKLIRTNSLLRKEESDLRLAKSKLQDEIKNADKTRAAFPESQITSIQIGTNEPVTEKFADTADAYLDKLKDKFENSPTHYTKGAITINGLRVELELNDKEKISKVTNLVVHTPELTYTMPEIGLLTNIYGHPLYIDSNSASGLLASIRSQVDNVMARPANTQRDINKSENDIEQLKKDAQAKFDDSKLIELTKESEALKEKMIADGNKKKPDEGEPDDDGGDDEPPVGPLPTGGVTGGVFDHTNIAGALDWLDNQKAKTGNTMMGMLIPIPPAIWNGAIDVMKGVLKATNSTQKAIRIAAKYIQDRGGSVAQAKDFEQSMNEKMVNTKAAQLAIKPDTEEALTPEEMLRGATLIQQRVKQVPNLNPDEQALSTIDLTMLNKKELHRYIEIGAVLAVDPQGVLTSDVNDFFARVDNRQNPKMGTAVPPPAPPVPPTGDNGLPEDEEPIEPRKRIPKADKLPMDPLAEEVEPERNLPEGTKQNYSIWGNLKDIHVRNLEQLKAYGRDISSMDALREAIKLATSRSQSSVNIKLANDRITRLIGEEGYQVLRQALIESRLRGTRERWNNFARQIKVSSDNDIDDLFAAGRKSPMYSIISDLQGYDDDENPALTILTHIDNGEYDDAREYMSDMFSHAAGNVAYYDQLSNGKTFDEITHTVDGELRFKDEKYQQALGEYKQHIEKPFRESHESNDGIFSDALGPLETYYPLTATGASAHKVYMPSKSKYNAPDNINNHFTTGSADQYSASIADLSRKLAASIKTNNKATFINALQEAGLMAKVAADSPNDGFISINGTPYPATKVPVSDARTIIQNGTAVTIPVRYMLIPNWLYKEIKPIIEGDDDLKGDDHYSVMGHVLNASVNLMLGGPAEAISHSHRLLSAITNSMPYMQEWAYKTGVLGHAGGLVLNNLFVKKFTGMAKVLFTNASSDEFANDVQEMAKLGLIPEKTWTHTYSAEFAKSMGVDPVQFPIPYKDIANGEWRKVFKKGKLFDFSPMLYGRNGFDLKARVVMYRLVKAMNPEATPEQHVKMQGDMGQYTQSLQGRVEKFIKKHGFGPFATFARTYYRAGFKAISGTTPLPLDSPDMGKLFSGSPEGNNARKFMYYKLAQLISSGVLGYIGYWALAHHAVTGHWPWDDKHSKIGKIPLTEEMKHTRFAKKFLYNRRTGAYDDLDMSFFNIPMSRGLRATGIDRAYQVNQLGGTSGQSVEAAQVEAANTMANMYTSSALISIPFTTMTGDAPYITTLRGYTGKPEPGFLKKVKTAPAGLQIPQNFAAGMMGINPLLESLNPASGAVIDEYNAEDYESGKLMKSIINIAMPGLISPHGSDAKQSGNLKKQAKAIQTTLDKEHHHKNKK